MSIMVVCLKKMSVVAVCETEVQAYYWADILCPDYGYHIDDFSFHGLDVFCEFELRQIYENTLAKDCPKSMMTKEIMIGSLLNVESDLINSDTVEQLYERLGREPREPVCLPGREHNNHTASRTATTRSTGQRQSGVRDVVFAKADEMWAAIGSPTEKSVILKLRKQIMDELEKEGVKRTTCSSTLGAWHIERAPY